MSTPFELDDDQLSRALRDVGAHLDLGGADTAEARAGRVAAILVALPDAPGGGGAVDRRDRRSGWLVAAAIVVVVGLAVVAVAPARQAVARWLGIGAVRIERTNEPPATPPPSTTSELPPAPTLADGSVDLDAVAADLPFPVELPSSEVAGEPVAAAIDPEVPSGLLEVRYPTVTFVAVAAQVGGLPVLGKTLGPSTVIEPVVVGGADGLWITGDPHEVGFVDPDGEVRLDRVRRAGDVLLWEAGGVTYRVEGAPSLEAALDIARSLG